MSKYISIIFLLLFLQCQVRPAQGFWREINEDHGIGGVITGIEFVDSLRGIYRQITPAR